MGDDGFEADRYYYFLKSTYEELNRNDAAALKAMVKAADLGRGSYRLKLEAARLYSRTGDNRNALKYARAAMTLDPEEPMAHLLTAWLAGSEGDRETAEMEYLKVLELTPGNPEALYWLGTLYFDSSRHREAEKFFKRLTVADPGAVSFYHLGHFYQRLNRKKEAIEALVAALKKDPDFTDALDDLAGLYEETGQPKSAEKTYRHLMKFRPQAARNGLARLLLKTGRRAEAEKIAAEILLEESRFRHEAGLKSGEGPEYDELDLKLKLGLIYMEIKRPNEAIGEFEAVLKARPGHDRASYLLASALMERQEAGGKAEAARAAELLEAIEPESSLYVEARLLLTSSIQDRDDRQALSLIEEAARFRPDSLRLKLAESHFLERLGELEKARTVLARTVETFGPEIKQRQHNQIFQKGKTRRRRPAVQEDGRIFPSEAEILFRLGTLEDRLGRQPAAIESMRQAINLNPSHADALNFLAYTWAERRENLVEALAMAEKADTLKPDQGYILDTVAWVHYQMGQPQKALPLLERAVPLSRRDPVVLDHLGDVLAALDRNQEALDAYRQALAGGFANQEELNEKIKKLAR
ncbi:MAG: tetratricopeptide repeat protein [Candidatus Adiutrix sp.]|jgi:tetratricopeptide (TPR) repeat protein|nr:tetratricopeptide repeat protein [Candidatus Adiutrix sp.]